MKQQTKEENSVFIQYFERYRMYVFKQYAIYKTNVNNLVTVNTAVRQSDHVEMPRIVQQGGGWGPMECSNNVDKLGKRYNKIGIHFYLYKHMERVLPLAMVYACKMPDDIDVIYDIHDMYGALTHTICMFVNMGVKRSMRTTGMQPTS